MTASPNHRRFPLGSSARALAAFALFFTTGCAEPAPSVAPPKPVRVVAVEAAPGAPALRYSAVVEPARQAFVAFEVGGRVVALAGRRDAEGRPRDLQPGDRVAKGEILARLANEQPTDRHRQAEAQLAEANAARVKARGDLDRARALHEARSLIRPELDAAVAAAVAADARVGAAEAVLDAARVSLSDASLAAPWAGIVVERRIEIGQVATAGSTGVTLAELDRVKAIFGVPEEIVRRIALGESFPVQFEGAAGTHEGRVTAIAPVANLSTRIFSVEVTLDNRDGLLRPGTIATVVVPGEGGDSTLVGRPIVPFAAVVRGQGEGPAYAVLVVDSARQAVARCRPVKLGAVVGSSVVVEAGVDLGERVIVSSPALLADGELVRIVP